MAVPTGTFTLRGDQTLGDLSDREDLGDIIYDISPMDTPFMSNIARGKATAVLHEWTTDSLAAANKDNATIEGDDATTNTASPTARYGNYCQIMDKVPRVSGTLRAVDTAGRRDELSYQIAKRGRELKRDIEAAFLSDNEASAGSGTTARKLAGAGAWLFGNKVSLGGTGQTTPAITSGVPTTAVVAGSATAFTEANLQSVLELCWLDGGEPDILIMDSTDKKTFSAFTGVATLYRDTQGSRPASILGSADLYISDWGEVQAVADRFMDSDAYVFAADLEYWEASYLRPIQQQELAKTGDSDRVQLICEVTLCAKNPDSSGKIYTTSP